MTRFEVLEHRLLLTTVYDAVSKKITITGTSGNDTISVSLSAGNTLSVVVNAVNELNLPSANLLSVLAEVDVSAAGGNDRIDFGTTSKPILTPCSIGAGIGADTVIGGAGNDSIFGGAGNDSMDGGLGADVISGGADNNTVSYATRATAVSVNLDLLANDGAPGEGDWVGGGTTDVQSVMGGAGNDTIIGNSLGNYLSGGAGADQIHGGAGNDTIVGGAGVDGLFGDDDNDAIFARDGEIDNIDGGNGIDSADTDPSEGSPLPAQPVSAPGALAPVAAAVTTPSKTIERAIFSTRRVTTRKAPLKSTPTKKKSGKHTPIIPASAPPAPAGPLPSSGVEGGIDAAALLSIIQPLDPYCAGQALVARDKEGNITIGGTPADDAYAIHDPGDDPTAVFIDITVNGGLTQFNFFTSPQEIIQPSGGNDTLELSAGPNSIATFKPDPNVPTAGTFMMDNDTLSWGGPGAGGFSTITATDFQDLEYLSPHSKDFLNVTNGPFPNSFLISGKSDAETLPSLLAVNAGQIILNTAANDVGPDVNDQINVYTQPGLAPPPLAPVVGVVGNDNLTVNGPAALVNDPTSNGLYPNTLDVFVTPTGALTIQPQFGSTRLASLKVFGGVAKMAPSGNLVLDTNVLDILNGGAFDLANNSIIIDYPAGNPAPANIPVLLHNGYNGGLWNGAGGIDSSQVPATKSRSIGYADAGALLGVNGGTFMGINVDASSTLIEFTLPADANLDRAVDFADLVRLAQSYGSAASDWLHGDFNYDSTTDFQDLVTLAQQYGNVLT